MGTEPVRVGPWRLQEPCYSASPRRVIDDCAALSCSRSALSIDTMHGALQSLFMRNALHAYIRQQVFRVRYLRQCFGN
jgi:hypothetical protein